MASPIPNPLTITPTSSGPHTLGGRVLKWVFRASIAAVVTSLTIHAVLLMIAAAIIVNRPAGAGDGDSAPVDLAVITQSELTSLEQEGLRSDPVSLDNLAMADPLPPGPTDAPVSEPGLAPGDIGGGSPIGGAGKGLGEGSAHGLELSGGAGGAASFFGVEARGARFVYIVDVSGSMAGPKIETLRRQLTKSINGLLERASFTVYFFSSKTIPLDGQPHWIEATDASKQFAGTRIRAIPVGGGTDPLPAFAMALTMRPKPDAIYFMTDGEINPDVVAKVAEMNTKGALTPIHTISFVSRVGEVWLKAIAKQSGGSYSHVSDPNL